ncbi:hypothetical protein [Devosia submarina]|uniref:hypothetical protein n=1 Tax=Devosia submarina TaxID=1173082 RepID=UPI00130066DD|nr:hypothetical protein [Devosia submarina]
MSWYQAIVAPEGALGKVGRELPILFFDTRSLRQLDADLKAYGFIEVERASAERRIECRGMMLLRDPHVMVIQQRPDLDHKHPHGPPPFQMRDLSKKLNPPVE